MLEKNYLLVSLCKFWYYLIFPAAWHGLWQLYIREILFALSHDAQQVRVCVGRKLCLGVIDMEVEKGWFDINMMHRCHFKVFGKCSCYF